MKFKLATAVAVSLLAAGAQAAIVDDLGTLTATIASSGNLSFADHINDSFTFNLTATSWVETNVTLLKVSVNLLPASYTIYSTGADHAVGGGDDWVAIPGAYNFGKTSVAHTDTLAAGSYYIKTFGFTESGNDGLIGYSLGARAVAVPVPEPETYALLAAGLGVIGFMASRRRRG